MASPKVIITKQISKINQNYLEDEIGLSTYDLALISINKIINNRKSFMNHPSKITYLI